MNLIEANSFLDEVKKLHNKIPIKEKTFLEISGYPHYENVISNILAFYLNPEEEHKLNDLLVKVLLKNINNSDNLYTSQFNVFREYPTLNGNRIDIVMQNESLVIGIENKINSHVYNDLTDYSKTLDTLNKKSIKILLSLRDEKNATLQNDFINITYSQFFKLLKLELNDYKYKDNKWYVYLMDLINNVEGVEVEYKMETEINDWINTHKEDIKKFKEILEIAQNNITQRLNEYEKNFEAKTADMKKMKYY